MATPKFINTKIFCGYCQCHELWPNTSGLYPYHVKISQHFSQRFRYLISPSVPLTLWLVFIPFPPISITGTLNLLKSVFPPDITHLFCLCPATSLPLHLIFSLATRFTGTHRQDSLESTQNPSHDEIYSCKISRASPSYQLRLSVSKPVSWFRVADGALSGLMEIPI